MIQPETRYTTVGNDSVAYQVLGEGPRDLVFTYGVWTSVDGMWEEPRLAHFFRRLAAFCRWISFDRRGSGLSDPRPQDGRSVWEHWIEDLIAVLDAVGSRAPVLLCVDDSSLLGLKFADVHPERCSGLVLFNGTSRVLAAFDYPAGVPPEQYARFEDFIRKTWGQDGWTDWTLPSQRENEHFRRWFERWCRGLASPRAVLENVRESAQMDVREVLPRIRVPALVMTRRNYRMLPVAHGRYIAEHMPSARFVEVPGADSNPFLETPDLILGHIEEFLTGARLGAEPDRALVALLFTDIVDSTAQAAKLGDAAWRALLDRHDSILRDQVRLFGGTIVDHAGDGSLSTFGDSRRAIECAFAVKRALNSIGVEIRAGIHFGEVERRDDGRLGGVAVHLGARVMGIAAPGEVLVSRTVRDILIGSRYEFGDRGTHELKGVPGQWQLYAVVLR